MRKKNGFSKIRQKDQLVLLVIEFENIYISLIHGHFKKKSYLSLLVLGGHFLAKKITSN